MKVVYTLFILCFCSLAGRSQSAVPKQLHFNFLGIENGLPEGTANCLLQDHLGYLWIGTQNGLVRYDGYQTKVYPLEPGNATFFDIQSLYEDRKGNLWIGSYPKGLYHYDRTIGRFINYDLTPPEQKEKESHVVLKTIEDNDGNLWMRVWNYRSRISGIVFFDVKKRVAKRFSKVEKGSHFINADNYYGIFKDSGGKVWIGTDNGFYDYNKNNDSFTAHFASKDSTQRKGVWAFAEDSAQADILWMTGWDVKTSKNEGLWRYDTRKQTLDKFTHDAGNMQSIANDEIFTIRNFKKGFLWIGTDAGISIFNTASFVFENYIPTDSRSNSNDNFIKSIERDATGNFWCESFYGWLYFNSLTKTFTRYTTTNKNAEGLQSNSIRSSLLTKDGILWFGAEQIGLQWINTNRSRFTLYEKNSGKAHHFKGGHVNDFAEAKDGKVWLTSNSGLYCWQPVTDSFTKIVLDKVAVNDEYTSAVAIDNEGIVWCRLSGGDRSAAGIYSYNPITKKITNYRHTEKDSMSLPSDYVQTMKFDHDDILWIGTAGKGICSFDKKTGKFTRYNYIVNTGQNVSSQLQHNPLDDDEVQTILIDKQNNVWVGTNNGNLNKFDRDSKTFRTSNTDVPGFSTVMNVFEDDQQNIWAGTYMSGLYRFDSTYSIKNYKRYTEADGLLYNGSWGINQDDNSNIWISSPRGLSILDPQTGRLRTVSHDGGLPAEPISFKIFKTSTGQFLCGSKDGFFSWNPDDFAPSKNLPPLVHIESVTFSRSAKGKIVDSILNAFANDDLSLKYNENRFTISYIGLQYQSPGMIRYAYKLDGYDKDWIDAGAERKVTYTNLSPGTYLFHIKAKNSDGIWSLKESVISIEITPPWWKTWWAFIIYCIVFVAAVWSFIAYRSARLKKENKLLEEKVEDRTKQLNESITELKATQNQLVQSEKMASLGELTAGIAHEIQNPLNFVNNFSEVNQELAEELKSELAIGNLQMASEIADDMKANSEKINQHGKRADSIIKGMLQHSRTSSGQKEITDINALVDEYLRLSYHGMRAKDPSFNVTLSTQFDEQAGKVNMVPQNIGRVLLNLFNNAFYSINEKKKITLHGYQPELKVSTERVSNFVKIIVSDNGTGVPENIINKVFQPFFTTKPTGQGTGLGLSLSYDIVTKEHDGKLDLESIIGERATFIITLKA